MHSMSPELIGPTEYEFLIALLLALVCGLLIGGERELKGKPAGLRTQTLVVSASMLFAFLSHSILGGDPTRIAAQIVTGVGFLGAGLILRGDGNKIDNVTTAASIWFAASVGMSLGFGYYFIAVVAAIYGALISRLPRFLRRTKPADQPESQS